MIFLAFAFGAALGYMSLWLADYLVKFAVSGEVETKPHSQRDMFTTVLISGLLFGLLFARLGQTSDFLAAAAFTGFLILIMVIDVKYRLILNMMVYPVGVFVLLWTISAGDIRTMVVGGLFAFGIFYTVRQMNPSQLGGGDVKLAALLGIVFGFPHILFVLLIGTGAGALAAVSMLVFKQGGAKQHIPYAPFLCIGALSMLLVQL